MRWRSELTALVMEDNRLATLWAPSSLAAVLAKMDANAAENPAIMAIYIPLPLTVREVMMAV